jgi:release factor glutamine methyltransferase
MNKELIGADNVTVMKCDILESSGFLGLPRPDMILSNPPYIKTVEVETLQPEIAFEPTLALDGGEDGLKFYRALSEIWYPFINRGGYLAMECGEDQAADVFSLFVDKAEKGKVIKDAADLDRVVVIAR